MEEQEMVRLYRAFYIFGDQAVLKILFELDRYGEKTFSELRDHLRINPSTLSKKLKLLTRLGLVAADRSHDRLRVYYALHRHQRTMKRILDDIERFSVEL